jgi:hypothetical protein
VNQYASFAYGTSRSGKTTYHTVVLLRDDLPRPGEELRMVQSFLFTPCEEYPMGVLNRPHSVHEARLSDVEDAIQDWYRVDGGVAEQFDDVVASDEVPPTWGWASDAAT